MSVFDDILAEMQRQDRLKAEGRFTHHTGDHGMSNAKRFVILSEEVGEVARAILEQSGLANDKHGGDLRTELVQVAAVCAKWVEGLDRRARARKAARSE